MHHILLIEDDPDFGPLLKRNLEFHGYSVILATNGVSGLGCALDNRADLILLDLMLPLLDGIHLLERVRRQGIETPVIIVSAKGNEPDRLEGFHAGCDDYLPKPFSFEELLARMRAVLRRCVPVSADRRIESGGIILDTATRNAKAGETILPLTPREFDLLAILMEHPNQALSRYFLFDEIWGDNSDTTVRSVDTHIATLRKKLDDYSDWDAVIETVYKVGYRYRLQQH